MKKTYITLSLPIKILGIDYAHIHILINKTWLGFSS